MYRVGSWGMCIIECRDIYRTGLCVWSRKWQLIMRVCGD